MHGVDETKAFLDAAFADETSIVGVMLMNPRGSGLQTKDVR